MIIKVLACYENENHQKPFERIFSDSNIESISIIPSDYIPCSVKIRLKSSDEFYIAKIIERYSDSITIKDILVDEMKERTTVE